MTEIIITVPEPVSWVLSSIAIREQITVEDCAKALILLSLEGWHCQPESERMTHIKHCVNNELPQDIIRGWLLDPTDQ